MSDTEHDLLRDTFRRFCDRRVRPQAAAIDEGGEFPRELFAELGALGFFGLRYPEEAGGAGVDLAGYCVAIEEIARGSLSLAACAAMQSLMGTHFIHALGDETLHREWLAPALRGERIGTICITEPDAGSDLGAIATRAERVDGGYRLTGQKMWITSAPVADFFTVFARTGGGAEAEAGSAAAQVARDGGRPAGELTIFAVERDTPGLTVGRTIDKMGVRGSVTSELSLDGCFVPEERRLGAEGQGEGELRRILSTIRIMTGALAVGAARAALADALAYAQERQQFGRPIARFQAIQLKLGHMSTLVEASRQLVAHAARHASRGDDVRCLAAQAKLFASESAVQVCDEATRILGSYGFAREYPVERHFRDIRFTLYGGGTSEILRLLIARELTS